jgi:LysR family glycine cleavage system transcriptional activator
VARLGSVTLAAKELHVTHSAISQQIKVLEEMVGLKLFIRHAACRLMKKGGSMPYRSARLCTILLMPPGWCRSTPRQELTLAMVPSFGCHWLLPRLERFREKYPHISLRIQASLAITSMQQEGADLAIRMGKGDWEGTESHYLFSDQLIVVAAPTYNGGVLPVRRQR